MSKYGYNPDEHFQTKVTLIDKDGFHKESDESNGSENESNNGHTFVRLGASYNDSSNVEEVYRSNVQIYVAGEDLLPNVIDYLNGTIKAIIYFGETKELQTTYTIVNDLITDLDWDFQQGGNNRILGYNYLDMDETSSMEYYISVNSCIINGSVNYPQTITDDTNVNVVFIYNVENYSNYAIQDGLINVYQFTKKFSDVILTN